MYSKNQNYAEYNSLYTGIVHMNFRAGSTFPVPVCTVPSSMEWTDIKFSLSTGYQAL